MAEREPAKENEEATRDLGKNGQAGVEGPRREHVWRVAGRAERVEVRGRSRLGP